MEKGKGGIQQVLFKKKVIFMIYTFIEFFMNLLMLVSDLSPAVQLHTEPEYKDETMTVHQIPLTGEHVMLQSERNACSVTLLKALKGATSV